MHRLSQTLSFLQSPSFRQALSAPKKLPVALLSSVDCELTPLKIVFLCVFFFYFYLSFYTCNVCNDVRQENTFGHWTALH